MDNFEVPVRGVVVADQAESIGPNHHGAILTDLP